MEVLPQNDPVTAIPNAIQESLIKEVALATDLIVKMVDSENYFSQLQSNHTIPTTDADVINQTRNVQSTDTIVAAPIAPKKNLPLEIREKLNKDIAAADDIIEEIIVDKKQTKQLHTNSTSTASNEEIKNKPQIDPITTVSKEIDENLIKEIATADDIIEEIIDNAKQTKQPHLDTSRPVSNEEIKNKQSIDPITTVPKEIDKILVKEIAIATDIIEEMVSNEKHQPHPAKSGPAINEVVKNKQPNDSTKAVSNDIDKELIKDVTTATAIIEKIIANKNYFNLLHEVKDIPFINTAPEQVPLGILSKRSIDSEQHAAIEKNLIKDIASAVAIINDIISRDIDTNIPHLKQTSISNKKIIAKKVRKIISTAIVSPNLIALEKSIKELLARRSIFTNFKA